MIRCCHALVQERGLQPRFVRQAKRALQCRDRPVMQPAVLQALLPARGAAARAACGFCSGCRIIEDVVCRNRTQQLAQT